MNRRQFHLFSTAGIAGAWDSLKSSVGHAETVPPTLKPTAKLRLVLVKPPNLDGQVLTSARLTQPASPDNAAPLTIPMEPPRQPSVETTPNNTSPNNTSASANLDRSRFTVPDADIQFVAELELPPKDIRYQLTLFWNASIIEHVPLFFPAQISGDQPVEVPAARVWKANEFSLIDLEKDFPRLWGTAFHYYFGGRSVYRNLSNDLRFSRVGVRAFRDWFLGSFELAKTSNVVGVDIDLIDTFQQFANRAASDGAFTAVLNQQFLKANSQLLKQYIAFPSARGVLSLPADLQSRFLK